MADQKKTTSTQPIVTPEFRLSFPNLVTPQSFEGGRPTFSITMLFPKDADISALKDLAREAATKRWGTDQDEWPKGMRLPFRDGDEKSYAGYEDCTYVRASANEDRKPGTVDAAGQPIINPGVDLYGGCYARAYVNAFAYDKAGNRGVAFGLIHVQKLRDGDAFGASAAPASEVFGTVPGAESGEGVGNTAEPQNDIFG